MAKQRYLTVFLIAAMAVSTTTTWALIERKLLSMATVIKDATYIFVAKIDAVDPNKPSMVLVAGDDLKGKSPFTRLPIVLSGDEEKHTPELLERIEPGLPVVVFITEIDKKIPLQGLAYSNGTWIKIVGQRDGEAVRWSFIHCEIYFRRTFKGTTDEIQKTVQAALSGSQKPPGPDANEPAGFGPKIERK